MGIFPIRIKIFFFVLLLMLTISCDKNENPIPVVRFNVTIDLNLPDYNKSLYEYNHNEHRHHMICIKCHKMQPVTGCPLEEYEKLIESKFDFTVKGHNLEVYGYCNGCACEK